MGLIGGPKAPPGPPAGLAGGGFLFGGGARPASLFAWGFWGPFFFQACWLGNPGRRVNWGTLGRGGGWSGSNTEAEGAEGGLGAGFVGCLRLFLVAGRPLGGKGKPVGVPPPHRGVLSHPGIGSWGPSGNSPGKITMRGIRGGTRRGAGAAGRDAGPNTVETPGGKRREG